MWPVFFAIYIESLQARKHWGRSCCSSLLHPCPKWTCPLLHSKKPWLWRLAFSVSGAAQSTSKKQGNYKKKKKSFPVLHLVLELFFKLEQAFKDCSVRQLKAPHVSGFKRRHLSHLRPCLCLSYFNCKLWANAYLLSLWRQYVKVDIVTNFREWKKILFRDNVPIHCRASSKVQVLFKKYHIAGKFQVKSWQLVLLHGSPEWFKAWNLSCLVYTSVWLKMSCSTISWLLLIVLCKLFFVFSPLVEIRCHD